MNIDHLKEFADLTETLNFGATAQRYYVSTSVISRHIASLEEELGVKLFERGSGQVSLTRAGEIFLEDALSILHDYDNALERLALLDKSISAVVRVGYLHNAARPFIARFAQFMRRQHPQIAFVFSGMKFRELYHALDEHRVDLNFMMDVFPKGERDYQSQVIYKDDLYVVANLSSPLAQKKDGIVLADLVEQSLMLPSEREYPGLCDCIQSVLAREPRITSRLRYIDIETLYLEVEIGDRVGFSSGFNRELFSDRVAFLPINDAHMPVEVSAFWRDTLKGEVLDACMEGIEYCRERVRPLPMGALPAEVSKPLFRF